MSNRSDHTGRMPEAVAHPHVMRVQPLRRCRVSLAEIPAREYERRQVFDLTPLHVEVTKYCSKVKDCPQCGQVNKAEFPLGATQPWQDKPALKEQRVARKPHWLHVADTPSLTHLELPAQRSLQAHAEIDILRDRQTALTAAQIADFERRYQGLLRKGYQANPLMGDDGGKHKQSPARNPLDRLRNHQRAVLTFMDDFMMPFDNNRAEHDLRMVKLKQKVSGYFRTLDWAKVFCKIRSYLSTACKNGQNILDALLLAMLGRPFRPPSIQPKITPARIVTK